MITQTPNTREQRVTATPSASALAAAIEVVGTSDGKYTFDVKVLATGAKFRVAPSRDPRQPRLWCISVRQCSAVAMPDPDSPMWIDRPGVPWADMPEAIDAVRADVASWLVSPTRSDLCRWLLNAAPTPTAAAIAEAGGGGLRAAPRRTR